MRTLHSTFRSKLGDLLGSTGWNIFRDGHLGGPQSEAPVGPRTRNWTWEKWFGESERHKNMSSAVCSPTHLTAGGTRFVVEKAITGNRRKREERMNAKTPETSDQRGVARRGL